MRRYVEVICAHCQRKWSVVRSEYNYRMKKSKSGNLFCSIDCSADDKRRRESERGR